MTVLMLGSVSAFRGLRAVRGVGDVGVGEGYPAFVAMYGFSVVVWWYPLHGLLVFVGRSFPRRGVLGLDFGSLGGGLVGVSDGLW